jgi:hypothetical protein
VGTSLTRNILRPPLGIPYDPRNSPDVGSYGGGVSCERGTPVLAGFGLSAEEGVGSL